MISYSDFEKAWFLYKTEYEPNNISINDFCIRKGLPYTEFYKWFRKTHKQIVPLEVVGAPQDSGVPRRGGIHVFIRTYDGLQIQKKGISYQDLVSLVEKLEDLC